MAWAVPGTARMTSSVPAAVTVPAMLGRPAPRTGRFVAVASAAGSRGLPSLGAYSATKHAAVGFAESLAITHGDDGIHVCLVCPQAVATRMTGVDEDTETEDGSVGFGGLVDLGTLIRARVLRGSMS